MKDVRLFDNTTFSSHATLERFFLKSPTVERVLSHKNKFFSKSLLPMSPNLTCKWRVCQVITAPFRWTLAIIFKLFSAIFTLLRCKTLSEKLLSVARHIFVGFEIYSKDKTKLFFIGRGANHPNAEGKEVNQHPPIHKKMVKDQRIRKITFISIDGGYVKFGHRNGICRGMSHWFLYLYLKTKRCFLNTRTHMRALSKQFKEGGGKDPTLLQSLYIPGFHNEETLLGIKKRDEICKFTFSKQAPLRNKAISALQNIPIGTYEIHAPLHVTAYVKINRELGYFFDPNKGIIEINGPEQGLKLHGLMSDYTERSRNSSKSFKVIPFYLSGN